MHICMIVANFPPKVGGLGLYVYHLSKKIVEKGHKVTVITQGDRIKQREQIEGIDVYRTLYFNFLRPFHMHFYGLFVNRILRSIQSNIDVVHVHIPGCPPILTTRRVIATVHTLTRVGLTKYYLINSVKEAAASNIVFPLDRILLKRANIITAVSKTVKEELFNAHKLEAIVIGNGVDSDFFVPAKNRNDSSRILFCGRLVLSKGLIELVKCAKYVVEKHPYVSFELAGSGDFRIALEELVKKEKLERNFIFLGELNREKLLRHYQNASIFVLPSYRESFPNVILEAMACGTPIVASEVGDVPNVVNDGENGFLVQPKDPHALASAILTLLENTELRRKMGEACRKRVEAFYSIDMLAKKIIDYYDFLIGSQK